MIVITITIFKKKFKLLKIFCGEISYLYKHINYKIKIFKIILRYFILFFIIIALSTPQWGKKDIIIKQRGTNIVFAVDYSRSMLCSDLKPNRFIKTKIKIDDLIKDMPADRIGLIGFAGTAITLCPLTIDKSAIRLFLDSLNPGDIKPGGTNLKEVIYKAIDMLKISKKGFKNLIIFTDGEDHSDGLYNAIEKAIEHNIRIFVIVMATPNGAPIPKSNKNNNINEFEKNSDGNIIISKPKWNILKDMISKTDGRLFVATIDNQDIKALISEINGLKRRELNSKIRTKYIDRYYYPAIIALFSLILEMLLKERKYA